VPSEVSGGLWTQYDETTPAIWRVPLRDQLVAARHGDRAQAPAT
jgi:hypothetical protein